MKRTKPATLAGIKVKGLRLKENADGTFTDQYGRLLEKYTNKDGEPDLRPVGLDPKGARH